MEYKPLFGTVSHDAGLYTLHFHKTGNYSGINRQGYGMEIFDGCKNLPVVRFDKASLENVMESIKGQVDEIDEYYILHSPWNRPITLAQYLEKKKAQGIPVEILNR